MYLPFVYDTANFENKVQKMDSIQIKNTLSAYHEKECFHLLIIFQTLMQTEIYYKEHSYKNISARLFSAVFLS